MSLRRPVRPIPEAPECAAGRSGFSTAPRSATNGNVSQYNRIRGPLVSARANTNVMFAAERGYDAEAQIMGMEMEGIDIAVLFPTLGLRS